MDQLLQSLRAFDALRDQVDNGMPDKLVVRSLDLIHPDYESDTAQLLCPCLQAGLRGLGIGRLYKHQAEAIQAALQGKDVVLEAPTASGKTLAFSLPMFDILLKNHNAHALMIHPMKALSNDQRRQIQDLSDALAGNSRQIDSWPFDGDTEQEHRKLLKDTPPAILLTNPEMLHYSFLGWADQWDRYLRNLKYIVIDEIHEYRGYFGTHFSFLLRRFLHKLHSLGVHPQLFLATATCANPKEHAENLTGRDVHLVSTTHRMRPERHFAFIDIRGIPDFRFLEIYQLRIARAALSCIQQNKSVICFCPSRKFAEEAAKKAKRDAKQWDISPNLIAPYRSGYTADERRSLEQGLRDGQFQAVFSTNALELGIDIGRLDVCILAGFPDSMMSAWQRIGRAGRSLDKKAYVIYFAMNNAYDQFFANNIDAFLEKPLDEITIGLENQDIMDQHIPFVLHEVNWRFDDASEGILGQPFFERVRELSSGKRPLVYGKCGPIYQRLNLRGISDTIYSLIHNGTEIGTISGIQAFREAYIGAIYNHCGKQYKVTGYGAKEIFLEETEPDHISIPSFFTVIKDSEILDAMQYGSELSLFYGKLTIYLNFSGYRIEDEKGNVIDESNANEARSRSAYAFWMSMSGSLATDVAVRAVEQMLRIGAFFVIPSDRHDTDTYSNFKPPLTVYFYEMVPGGIGIAKKAYHIWGDALKAGVRIAEGCECKDGCPKCIHPPRLRDAHLISKSAGLILAEHILNVYQKPPDAVFDSTIHGWKSATIAP